MDVRNFFCLYGCRKVGGGGHPMAVVVSGTIREQGIGIIGWPRGRCSAVFLLNSLLEWKYITLPPAPSIQVTVQVLM